MNSFGEVGRRLKWDATPPGDKVDFMDLTITLLPTGDIVTSTYQKPMNLYLYLPPSSAHAPALFQSIVYSTLKRLRIQNTHDEDFQRFVKLFFERLLARGHTDINLSRQFLIAAEKLDLQPYVRQPDRKGTGTGTRLFLHVRYHPSTPSRRLIRDAFQAHCEDVLDSTKNGLGRSLQAPRLTIAYSRCKRIRDLVSRSRLQQSNDHDVRISDCVLALRAKATHELV
jgi:hypothetical protein